MYQMLIGSLLGVELLGDKLHFMPCFPVDWPSVSIVYKYRTAVYNISIFQIEGAVSSSWKNGTLMGEGDSIRLEDDGMEHEIEIRIAVRDKEVIQAMGGSGA
jgi:cellobiose phosphorylase